MAARGEEIVFHADALNAENCGPDVGQRGFDWGARRHVILRRVRLRQRRIGQRLARHLPARSDGYLVHQHER